MNYNKILVDFGNSRAKISFFNKVVALEYNYQWIDQLSALIPKSPEYTIYYSSVNERSEKLFLSKMKPYDINIINIQDFVNEQKILDISKVEGAGTDRLLGLFGAYKMNKFPFTTIDCGSALTINFATKKEFIGGLILPGIYTQMKALAALSPKLKIDKFSFDFDYYGDNTKSATTRGILISIVSTIQYVLDKSNNEILKDINKNVYITGGYSEEIINLIDKKYSLTHNPSLVLDGIEFLIENK